MLGKSTSKGARLPVCHEQIISILQYEGGTMERGIIRERLLEMGYSYYCVYEAFRRLEWKNDVEFEGSGHSPKQKLHLNKKYLQ